MRRVEDARISLASMGATADEVASTLRTAGIRGIRNAVRVLNPIVRYLADAMLLDNLFADVAGGKTLHINGGNVEADIDLPPPVIDFLHRFNRGEYPDLELNRDSAAA